MNQQRLMQVLLAPQVSEKATYVADKNEQVVFRVASDATKPEVKAAVELLFKVVVDSLCRSPTSKASKRSSGVSWAAVRVGKRHMFALRPVRKSISSKGGLLNGTRQS